MFTGIIETLGTIRHIERGNRSLTLCIVADLSPFDMRQGGSLSVDGVCLTVESLSGTELFCTAVYETLRHTTLHGVKSGSRVNLERAVRLTDRLDGHLVLGHVDGTGSIVSDQPVGDSLVRAIAVPAELMQFIAVKGSIAIDGVSLTVSGLDHRHVTVSIIPETYSRTTVSLKKVGDPVNIECDILARYVGRFYTLKAEPVSIHDEYTGTTRLESLLEKGAF